MAILKHLIYIAATYLLVLFQQSFLPHFNILGHSLNLLFIFVFLLSIKEGKNNRGLLAGFWGGLWLDLLSGWPLGFFTICLTLTAILTHQFTQIVQKNSLTSLLPLYVVSFAAYQILFFIGLVILSLAKHNSELIAANLTFSSLLAIFIIHLAIILILALASRFWLKRNLGYGSI